MCFSHFDGKPLEIASVIPNFTDTTSFYNTFYSDSLQGALSKGEKIYKKIMT